jgi:hypothetical protein
VLLDEMMPDYEFGEDHSIRLGAPPEVALRAVKSVPLGEMPLVRLLFAIRSLPASSGGKRGLPADKTASLYEQMLAFGFVRLGEEPAREMVLGVVGQMFRLRGGVPPDVRDARSFLAFEEPGFARVAMNFSVEAAGGGATLSTETRVVTTDPDSRRRFGRYWRLIRPGSAAIRRSWLRAAKRQAEGGEAVTVASTGERGPREGGPS